MEGSLALMKFAMRITERSLSLGFPAARACIRCHCPRNAGSRWNSATLIHAADERLRVCLGNGVKLKGLPRRQTQR